MTNENPNFDPGFDPDTAAAELKLDSVTKTFALALLRGASQWEATGPGEQASAGFRKKVSVKARSQRVCKYLARAQGREDVAVKVSTDGPLSDAERRLILADAARRGTGGIRVRAALADYQIGRGSEEREKERKPAEILAELAEYSPELAGQAAAEFGITFQASAETLRRARQHVERVAKSWIADHPQAAREYAEFWLRSSPPHPNGGNVVRLGDHR